MNYYSKCKGIIFVKGKVRNAKILQKIESDRNLAPNAERHAFYEVKEQLVEKAIALGANAVVDFDYGQKACPCLNSSLFLLDKEMDWHACGMAAILSKKRIREINNEMDGDISLPFA